MTPLSDLSDRLPALEAPARGSPEGDGKPVPNELVPVLASGGSVPTTTLTQKVILMLGILAFLYFGRPVILPIVLAAGASMTLKPLVRWLSDYHVPPAFSAALVLGMLVATIGISFFFLGRPALQWMNEAPQHLTELRQRFQSLFPRWQRFNQLAAAMNNLGATEAEKSAEQLKTPTVEVRDRRGAGSLLNWTGSLLVGIGETLVLTYLLLASGDLFLQKLVHIMPTFGDKKRAVEMSHEVQKNMSNYLFSVTVINIGIGALTGLGLYFIGVPNPAMWGMIAALFNYIPYFGPVAVLLLLGTVGFLSFDLFSLSVLPAGWYFLLHLFEANLVTPILLGRRFTLNPVVIFGSLIFWTWLWGTPGALLSVPILVSFKVVCERIPAMANIDELLSSRT